MRRWPGVRFLTRFPILGFAQTNGSLLGGAPIRRIIVLGAGVCVGI